VYDAASPGVGGLKELVNFVPESRNHSAPLCSLVFHSCYAGCNDFVSHSGGLGLDPARRTNVCD